MEEIGANSNSDQNEQHINTFRILHTIVQLIGFTIIILMASWISLYLGGFGWSTPKLEFNWHPMLMVMGMIYLYGNCKKNVASSYVFRQYVRDFN